MQKLSKEHHALTIPLQTFTKLFDITKQKITITQIKQEAKKKFKKSIIFIFSIEDKLDLLKMGHSDFKSEL